MRALFLLAIAACENAPSKLDAIASTSVAAPGGITPYVLLDKGMEPRMELRYQLAPTAQAYRAETRITTHRLVDTGFIPATALPPIRDGFTIAPTATGLALTALPAETVGGATAEAASYIREWRLTLMDRKIAVAVDARGQLGAVTIDGADADHVAHDQVVQRLLGTMVPLPAEPIGLGGTWRVQTRLRQGPIDVVQTATYALVGMPGGKWAIALKVQRRGDRQALTGDGAAPGAELVDLFRELDGTVIVDPAQPLPISGTITLDSQLHMRTPIAGQPPREDVAQDTGTVEFLVGT